MYVGIEMKRKCERWPHCYHGCRECFGYKVAWLRECQKYRREERERIRRGMKVGFAPLRNGISSDVVRYILDYVYIKVPCDRPKKSI